MMHVYFVRFLRVFTMALFAGCSASTAPTEFFVLNADVVQHEMKKNITELSVGVGPIQLPEYLERPQILTRKGENQLHLSEFHRWAGSLHDDLGRIMTENLAVLLGSDRVYLFSRQSKADMDYIVAVDILQFDGVLGEKAVLSARWSVSGKKKIIRRKMHFHERLQGDSYGALMAGHNKNVGALCREIALIVQGL